MSAGPISRRWIALALLAGAFLSSLSAFTLEPMSLTLEPAGPRSIGSFRLSNDAEERVAVSIRVLSRSSDAAGTEINGETGGDFVVFPSRILLGPKESKVFKIQWRGAAAPTRELAFRLVAEQIPVDFGEVQSSGIKLMFRYVASVYVAPPDAAPKLLIAARGVLDPEGRPGFELSVRNEGNRHVLAFDSVVELATEGSPPLLLAGASLGSVEGANYLAGSERRFFLPHAGAIPGKAYEGGISYTPEF